MMLERLTPRPISLLDVVRRSYAGIPASIDENCMGICRSWHES
jgi:hypothetical protein